MAIDWASMRSMMIRAHGIRRANDKFAFYYDETNNICSIAVDSRRIARKRRSSLHHFVFVRRTTQQKFYERPRVISDDFQLAAVSELVFVSNSVQFL